MKQNVNARFLNPFDKLVGRKTGLQRNNRNSRKKTRRMDDHPLVGILAEESDLPPGRPPPGDPGGRRDIIGELLPADRQRTIPR